MLLAESDSPDFHRLLEERFGLGVSAHGVVEKGEVVEAVRKVWVLLAESDSPDFYRLLEERFGFSVLSLLIEEGSRSICSAASEMKFPQVSLETRRDSGKCF